MAVSGGIDSVALLRLLLELRSELGIVLSVVHFNHKLRGAESDGDEEFVKKLARAHDLEFFADRDDVAQKAAEEHISVETAAREVRYGFFRSLIGEDDPQGQQPDSAETPFRGAGSRAPSKLDKIVTGHTLDDQAETVLMRMIRGAGLTGLGGIHPRIFVEKIIVEKSVAKGDNDHEDAEICGEIVRPLLTFRRCELEQYLREIGQSWREDATNSDTSFTRNRVRKLLVPLLESEFNPSIAENLAELAELARGEEDYWENEVAGWMGTAAHWSEPEWAHAASSQSPFIQIETGDKSSDLRAKINSAPWLVMNASVDRFWFLGEPIAVQRRLIKAIGREAGIPLEFKHVEEIVRFAAEHDASGKQLSLPLGWKLLREPDALLFVTPDLRQPVESQDYEYTLTVPGQAVVLETGLVLEARRIPAPSVAGYNPDHLLDAESLPGPLSVRNWRPGDRFWPAHTKSSKKIKELLQERRVAQPERRLWPVIVSGVQGAQDGGSGNEIVWMREFSTPAKFRARPGCDAILITEKPLDSSRDMETRF